MKGKAGLFRHDVHDADDHVPAEAWQDVVDNADLLTAWAGRRFLMPARQGHRGFKTPENPLLATFLVFHDVGLLSVIF